MISHKLLAAVATVSGLTLIGGTPLAPPAPPVISVAVASQMRAFGRAVAISGDFAFVGEPNVGGGGGRGGAQGAVQPSGVVHIYRNGATGWKKVDSLLSSATFSSDGFGTSLAVDGATLLVGQVTPAPVAAAGRGGRGGGGGGGAGGAGGGGRAAQTPPAPPPVDTAVGTVQVFQRNATNKWVSAGSLVGSTAGGSQFGSAIVIKNDVALVGAPGEPNGGNVYVFTRGKDGKWSAGGTLPAQGLEPGDRFGASIGTDGNRVAVGAPSRRGKGSAFVFLNELSTWSQESEQAAPGNLPENAAFGTAVAVKGDRVMVGAPSADFTQRIQPNPARDSLLAQLATTPAGSARDSLVGSLVAMTGGGRAGRGGAQGGGGGGRGRGAQIPLNPGVVITYQRASFGSWRLISTLAPFDFGSVAFGSVLRPVGDELWIGAPGSDGSGRIYRARADKDGAWMGMTKLGVDTIETGAQWSASFDVNGSGAIVGMPGDGGGGGTVAFMGKDAAGAWNLKALVMPALVERYPAVAGKEVKCATDGMATAFECSNTGLLSYMPLSALGAKRGVSLSGNWGWTDPVTGHDIAIIGRTDGAAFVDVTDPLHPRYLGDLMRTKGANMSSWREIKTYKNYALIVSDGSGDHHGIQIFDLTHLRNVTAPKHYTEDAHFDAGSIHDIAVNEGSGFAYAVGTASGGETCRGGLLMVDMRVPLKPTFAGCFNDVGTGRSRGGYTHDVQCVMYHGPDTRYTKHEICMASNETTVSIQDVTDKKNIKVLAHADYPTPGYTHQGWFTDDQRYWYLDDETDETGGLGRSVEGTRTMIFDVTDLEQPVMKKEFIGTTKASDHNLYVKGDRIYQSNYSAGLRILDITDPLNPKEVGYLDTSPGVNAPGFSGSWNNYPFFKNGAIGVSSGREGFFLVKDRTRPVVP